jgi:hypothetical protein
MGLIFVFIMFVLNFIFDIFRIVITVFEWIIKGSEYNDKSINK